MFEGKVYWTETVAENDGGFKVHNVSDGGAPGAIWTYDSKYKYWKATGYIKGKNYATESYLISPEIDLTAANNPQLSFDAALNYLKGADASAVLGVKVSEIIREIMQRLHGKMLRCLIGLPETVGTW